MTRRVLSALFALILLSGLISCAPQPAPAAPEAVSNAASSTSSTTFTLVNPFEEEEAPKPADSRLTLVVTGDLMAHIDQVWDAHDPETDTYDFNHCFEQVKNDLNEGYAIGNLETVFGGPEIGYHNYPRFSTPDAYGYALKENGFDFVSACNNHSMDWNEAAVLRTRQVLDKIGLAHTGTYSSAEEQSEITIVEAEGFKIAILAFTFSTNGIPLPQGKEYLVNMLTEKRLISDLAAARALKPDLIAVMPHMGNEYEEYTRDVFLHWMDLALYHGADFVFASHPHVLQQMLVRDLTDIDGIERQGFIICSLGNFISSQRDEPRDISIILKLDILRRGCDRPIIEAIRFVPTWVQFRHASEGIMVRVLPVGDAIESLSNSENPLGLLPRDTDRLYRANSYITNLYLGEPASFEDIAREYTFYQDPDCEIPPRFSVAIPPV